MKNDFKLKIIFEIEKDRALKSSGLFRKLMSKKYDLSPEDCNILYREITNYQIKTYGTNLNSCYMFK